MGTSQVPMVLKSAYKYGQGTVSLQIRLTQICKSVGWYKIREKQCHGHIYGPISKPRLPVKFPWPKENFKTLMLPILKKEIGKVNREFEIRF